MLERLLPCLSEQHLFPQAVSPPPLLSADKLPLYSQSSSAPPLYANSPPGTCTAEHGSRGGLQPIRGQEMF